MDSNRSFSDDTTLKPNHLVNKASGPYKDNQLTQADINYGKERLTNLFKLLIQIDQRERKRNESTYKRNPNHTN